jgi:S-(hydroxymethyl)glutathione dehydrogenase/alcohol dehydrogenase
MRGAIFDGTHLRVVDELEVDGPGPGQVAVRMVACGLCHSDVSVVTGQIPYPVPVVLGHEGAGIVESLGQGVTGIEPGTHVVLSTLTSCGRCPECGQGRPTMCRASFGERTTPFRWAGTPTYSFANASVFAERAIVAAAQVIPIPDDVPFEAASLIGCAVLTGVGAALHRARVQLNDTAVVIGVGGIGLNAIQGCRLAGASRIVAIDANPDKEALARTFGATDFLSGIAPTDLPEAVRGVLPNGADHVFECVGHLGLIEAAVECLDWGGKLVLVGVPPADARPSFSVAGLYMDKSILGMRYGSSKPHFDIPRFVDLYRSGALLLDELVTSVRPLDQIGEAVHALEHGTEARCVLIIPAA